MNRKQLASSIVCLTFGLCSCEDPPPPPGQGALILGVRVSLPESPLVLPGGQREDLSGLAGLRVRISRIDVVHRTVEDDPSTERTITIDEETRDLTLLGELVAGDRPELAFLNAPKGYITQLRAVVSSAEIEVRGEVHLSSFPAGRKLESKSNQMTGRRL